ncbi:MAG: response regulator [Proteobacteria bacterium]|nr:response regulator [Pseudomonadota bacterium]
MSTPGLYDLAGINVLLVNDNIHMRRIIRTILVSLGVKNITEAEDTSSGLKEARNADLDLIICSWLMDVIEGPEFVQLIRRGENSVNPYIPIIMMSAFTERFRVMQARDAGVNEFLAKPVSPTSLYQRIVSIIEKPRPFIRIASFFGPCRRRQTLGPPHGIAERRQTNPTPTAAPAEKPRDVAQG